MSRQLGSVLRQHRLKEGVNISTVAVAIGVDRSYLSKIEHGHETPPPSLLNRIINYFHLDQQTALEITKAAGYGYQNVVHFSFREEHNGKEVINVQEDQSKAPANAKQVNLPNNVPVLYTDSVFVTGSKWGVVLDIAQNVGPTNQQNIVARIGMSREHAEALADVLAKQLTQEKLQRVGTGNVKN